MEVCFNEEDATSIVDDIMAHNKAHHAEIPILNAEVDIDYGRYAELEKEMGVKCYTARFDGKLIGYILYFLNMHILFKTKLIAAQNAVYVDPLFRTNGIGARLLTYSEKALKENGVHAIMQSISVRNDFSGLVKKIGYTKLETVYIKEIGQR